MRKTFILLLAVLVLGRAAQAHELWIEPLAYQPPAEGRVEAQLVNGQNFAGVGGAGLRLAYLPRWFSRFEVVLGDRAEPVAGRMGDTPALSMAPLGDGLHVALYQSAGDVVKYTGWGKFETFIGHKGFQGIEARHLARGLSQDTFAEYYTRYSKSLIGVGSGAGADRDMGFETELVALDNPYTLGGDRLRVRLSYQGAARANVQVELFEKSAAGEVTRTVYMTDDQGVAVLPVKAGHSYMVDAVVIREPSAALAQEKGVVWETLWANLTFAVPG
jgi:uncharacterized GH25 family protein